MSEQGLTGYQIQGYAQHLKLEEKSEATLEKYLRDIRAFAAWANGQKISKELTAEWKNHLVEQHYAPTSINAMLSALNSLLEFLGLNDCRVKFLKVQRRLFRDADRELTKDDYQRLLNPAYQLGRDRLGLLVETIGATGIRVSEVKYVTVEAIRQGKPLEDLPLSELQKFSLVIGEDVYPILSLQSCLDKRAAKGGVSPQQVAQAIAFAQARLG